VHAHDAVDGEEQAEGGKKPAERLLGDGALHVVGELTADRAAGHLADGELGGEDPVDVPEAGGSSWTATTCERFRLHSGCWAGVAEHGDCQLVAALGAGIVPAKINTKVH
jgi:hypothetical protein